MSDSGNKQPGRSQQRASQSASQGTSSSTSGGGSLLDRYMASSGSMSVRIMLEHQQRISEVVASREQDAATIAMLEGEGRALEAVGAEKDAAAKRRKAEKAALLYYSEEEQEAEQQERRKDGRKESRKTERTK